MKIIDFCRIKEAPRGGVIALGLFDGMHIAHRELLISAKELAKRLNAPFGVFTFLGESGIKRGTKRLYSTEERLLIIEELGADFTVTSSFPEISEMSAESFVSNILIKALDAKAAVSGYNFRFGKGAIGDATLLRKLMKREGRAALIKEEISEGGEPISSTRIRSLIESGDMKKAARLLGAPYFISGRVLHGEGKGAGLGFPTVNLPIEEGKVIPRLGVYRSLTLVDGELCDSVTNVGRCPTLGEREVHLEAHLIGKQTDLYGKNVKVFLIEFLRDEKAFSSQKELIMQINIDKNTTIKRNGEEKWQELGLK